ncbi:M48 family metallopeptidase [Ottowia testudinis]|uniref:M48 family metallopeptidase n=1 Tax=Ottowia testudinis TaxID=2816950 RepID=A0A975CF60_9BURK|nr:M48 family metallopeptidase [Ottowia testudinis]QTD44697.1 M48 family metallopeptidase [Ottowia testudinis]
MRYRNPPLPARDAVADLKAERREFLQLLGVVALLVIGLLFVLDRIALFAAPRLPFAWEMQVARTLHLDQMGARAMGGSRPVAPARQREVEVALQARIDRIAKASGVPPEMTLTAHYIDNPTVNAFATLGGHITVLQGLLSKIEFNEELDAVLAHEIAHVQHRHMVKRLSRGLSMAAALGLVGIRSPALNRWLIGDAQQLQQLAYSRDAEREADTTALQASQAMHGHTGGVARLFERFSALQREQGKAAGEWTAFLQSHPLPAERTERARASGPPRALTPLDAVLKAPAAKR